MILHDNLSSGNGYKVRLLLAQLGLPFERIEYGIDRGETRTPEFLSGINPNGRIPVLQTDGGELLSESGAILFYLAEGTPFLPEERLGRAHVLRWMFFERYSQKSQNARARVQRPAGRGRGRAVPIAARVSRYVPAKIQANPSYGSAPWRGTKIELLDRFG